MFTGETIQERMRERPFIPVRIVTTTGQTYDISHPDLVWVGEQYLMIGTASAKNPSLFNQVTRLAILHVTELQDLPTLVAPGQNGPV